MVPKVDNFSQLVCIGFGTILFVTGQKLSITKGKVMTKTFQNFKEEYLKELGPEAKEEYNKALEELKEEQQK